MNKYMKGIRFERIFAWIVFLLFIRYVKDRLSYLYHIIIGDTILDYCTFDISDWLINYEGGFVRRGILGQILLKIEQLYLYDVRIAISVFCFVASIAILIIIVRIFKKEGWSVLILPTGFVFGFTLFRLGGRRDLLSLLLTYVIFLLFKNFISHSERKIIWWLLFCCVSVFQILMHEASFFYTFPILMLLFYNIIDNNQKSFCKKCLICFIYFLPVILTMATVCFFNGDSNTPEIIWSSWEKVFRSFPCYCDTTVIGEGVDALSWGTKETFVNHLKASYIGSHSPSYMLIPIAIFNLLSTYLLVSRINSVDMGIYRKRQMDNVFMSNVLLIQFAAMIPMFTVLSCDWGRTIPYWILSSLFFYHIFKKEKIHVLCIIPKVSHVIQKLISNNQILCNKYTYILLVLLTPIPMACAPFDFANTFQQSIIKSILYDINNIYTFVISSII